MTRLRERILAAGPFVRDALLAAALASAGLLELVLRATVVPGEIGLVLLMTVPIAWRRRSPLISTVLVMGAVAAARRNPGDLHLILAAILVTMFSLGTYASGRAAIAGLAFALGALWTSIAFMSAVKSPGALLGDAVSVATVIAVPFAVGRVLRGRELRVVTSVERVAVLERERDEDLRHAASKERERIARELHDVVAHGVTVMVVQAGAADQIIERDPARAREALVAIQDTGRQALTDLRLLLGLMRDEDTMRLAPRPGLQELDALVDEMRKAGVPIEVEIQGTPRDLPAGIDLSAYRILQEALTNVLKHAGGARARIVVVYAPNAIELEVVDNGRAPSHGHGHGLVGMRERVTLYGGTLEAGPAEQGGYRVRARLPLDGAT